MSETNCQLDLFGDTDDRPVKILTVQQPWAWAIIHAGKDVENRPQYASYRGQLLIHAGQKISQAGIEFLHSQGIEMPPEALETGHIVGKVELTGCVRDSESRWAIKDVWHNVVSDPVATTHRVEVTGRLGMTRPPEGWEHAFAA
jgi:ASCH domain